jgi:hypothetical protein
MAYELNLEPGEKVIFESEIAEGDLGEPFLVAVSDRAVYFPRKKWFALSDPYRTLRLELSELREVSIRGSHSLVLMVLGALAAGGGVAVIAAAMTSFRDLTLGLKFGAFGVLLVWGAFGRQRIIASTVTTSYTWRRPLRASKEGRRLLSSTLHDLLSACRRVGVYVPSEPTLRRDKVA